MNNKRPLSPHLQIYKPQLTSVLSITHRFTGVVLSLFSILIPFSLLIISLGSDYYQLFLLIFLDMGLGLSIKDSYMSGYLVILLSVILTSFTIFYIS